MKTKHRVLSLVLIISLFLAYSVPAHAADSQIPIYNWSDLNNIRNNMNGAYILMNDLDESSAGYDVYVRNSGWLPIGEFVGTQWDPDPFQSIPFTGTFDGNNHTISGLISNRLTDDGVGLFAYLRFSTVSNLHFSNVNISGHRHVGALAGFVYSSTVTNCHVSGYVKSEYNVGGLLGTVRPSCNIIDCSSSAVVVGQMVIRSSLRCGGLIGAAYSSVITGCHATGRVTGNFFDTGGLIGSIYDGTQISDCYTTGDVIGTGAVAGLVGSTNQASVITNCFTTGTVTGSSQEVGGLIGNINYGTSVTSCFSTGDVSGAGEWVGGLIGIVCNGSTVRSSYALGNVTNTSSLTGGLVGHISTNAAIYNSYARGNVSGSGGVGGLVGLMDNGIVTGCYSTGTSSGGYAVGGLIGARNSSIVTDSYWDVVTSGLGSSSGGTGLTTTQMVYASSYPGWNFTDLWKIATNASYPYFLWQGNINIPYAPGITPNSSPNAVNDSYSINEDSGSNSLNVLSNDSDPDDDTISIIGVTQGTKGIVSFNTAGVTYTPQANFYGADSFTYTISDGRGGTDTATVSVTVTNINDAPISNGDLATVAQNSTNNSFDVLANDSDPDGDSLTLLSVTQAAHGTVSIIANQANYTPAYGYSGSDSFNYTVSDNNGGSDSATVSITVTSINSAPNAVNDSYSVDEDSGSNSLDVLSNDSDPDGDAISVIGVTQGANGTVSFNTSSVNYTPIGDFFGADSFSYTINDGKGGTDTATVSVTVTNINDAPLANADQVTVEQNSNSNIIDVLANDSDPDEDSLILQSVVQPAHGTVTIEANQASYTPDAGFDGTDSFEYTVSDGNGGTAAGTVDILVINNTATLQIDMTTSIRKVGKNTFIKANATVNTGIPNATVQGVWSDAASDSDTGITGTTGNVTLVSNEIKYRKTPLKFTFTVTSVKVNGIEFNLQGEIQDTITFTQ